MAAVWIRARAEIRTRRRALLLMVLLVAITGAAVLTAGAGARRTRTAFDRALDASMARDVAVSIQGDIAPDILDRIAALPQVAAVGKLAMFPADGEAAPGEDARFRWDISAAAPTDDGLARLVDVPRVVAGRQMNFDDPGEATANEAFLREHGLAVGDTFTIRTVTFPELFELFGGRFPTPTGPKATVRIVGVWKLPHDVAIEGQTRGILYLSRGFYREHGDRAATLSMMFVRLQRGLADVDGFVRDARALVDDPDALGFEGRSVLSEAVGESLRVQAAALWIFAGVLALGGALMLGQAMARALSLSAGDHRVLHALGMSRHQRFAVALAPAVAVAVLGALGALALAVAASPLVPLGSTREIDPDLGLFVDAPALALGALAAVVVVLLGGAVAAASVVARTRRAEDEDHARPSALVGLAARAGAPVAAVAGVRFAVRPGRGATAVPVRSVLVGAVASVVAVVAAFTFSDGLRSLLATPRTWGWNWDVVVYGGEDPQIVDEVGAKLAASPLVIGLSRVSVHTVGAEGFDLPVAGIERVSGGVAPAALEGRLPERPDEIALATKVMRRAGKRIGDRLVLPGSSEACGGAAACPVAMRVVGRAMFWGENGDPGDGAVMTLEGVRRLRRSEGFSDFLVRLAPGVDARAAERRLERELDVDVALPELPESLQNLSRVRILPPLLGAALAALALATVAHALVTCVRRRRRDLAILKTLGFVRRQVASAVAWQSTTLVVVALAIGVPAGVASGRWAWRLMARALGVDERPTVPALLIAAGAAGGVVLANLVASLPARSASRTQPAVVLRNE